MGKPLFRYPIDVISVLVVFAAFGIQLTAYLLELPWYTSVVVIAAMRFGHLAQHNHGHLAFFHSTALNEAIGWVMFLNGGLAMEFHHIHHVQTHHRYTNREHDWTSPFHFEGARFPDKPVHWLYYILTYSFIGLLRVTLEILRRPLHPASKRFYLSLLVVGGACAWLIHHDARGFLIFFYLTWWGSYIGVPITNILHHQGCEYHDIYTAANVDLSFLCRLAGFNIGYHTAHHAKPTLHWSLLPAFHWKRMAPHTPAKYYRPVKPKSLEVEGSPVGEPQMN